MLPRTSENESNNEESSSDIEKYNLCKLELTLTIILPARYAEPGSSAEREGLRLGGLIYIVTV